MSRTTVKPTKDKGAEAEEAAEAQAGPRTYDDLLGLLGGGRGRYQLLVLACLTTVKMFPGMITLSHSFAKSSLMAYQCDINATLTAADGVGPDCWYSAAASPDQCRVRLTNCTEPGAPAELPCRDWQFDRSLFTETIASRFRLVCSDAHLADLAATGFFAGFLVGASLFGVIGDRFGRLPAALICMTTLTLMTGLSAIAPAYWLYAVAMAIGGVGNGGLVTVVYSSGVEATDADHRLVWGFTVNQGWTVGMFVLTLVAYLERNYQYQLLWLCAASLPLYPVMLLAGESTRWLVTTGRTARADAAIKRLARVNKSLDRLPQGFSSCQLASGPGQQPGQAKASMLDLFRTPGLRRTTLLSWLHWFSASLAYYGISLGASAIGGDIFLNMALVSAVELPARFLPMVLTTCRVGRKPVLYVSFALSAVFLAAMVAVFEQSASGSSAANVVLAVMSKLSITCAFDCVWLYYCEVFPTVIRSAGVGSGSTMARAAAMVSTQLLPLRSVWAPLPFVLFGIGPVLACLVIYFQPETLGQALPETVPDGEAFVQRMGGHCACGARVGDAGQGEGESKAEVA